MDSAKLNGLLAAYPARVINKEKGYVITMPVRIQWPALAEAKAMKSDDGTAGKAKYSACCIIPATVSDLSALNGIANAAAAAKWTPEQLARFKGSETPLRSPLRNQSVKKDFEGFGEVGKFFTASANPDYPPSLFGLGGPKDVVARADAAKVFYPGSWALAKVNAYAYENKGNRGVAFGLLALQKLADDKELSTGGGDNSEGFGPVAGAADDNADAMSEFA